MLKGQNYTKDWSFFVFNQKRENGRIIAHNVVSAPNKCDSKPLKLVFNFKSICVLI